MGVTPDHKDRSFQQRAMGGFGVGPMKRKGFVDTQAGYPNR